MKSLWQSNFKTVKTTLGRHLSILLVSFLGAGVFGGLQAVVPFMQQAGDNYFEWHDLMDIRIYSPLGLNTQDIELLEDEDLVNKVQSFTTFDTLGKMDGDANFRVHSFDETAVVLQLAIGRLPNDETEAVIVVAPEDLDTFQLNQKVSLNEDTSRGYMHSYELTIVGTVTSGVYPHTKKGVSMSGNGDIDYVLFVPVSQFLSDTKNDAYLWLDGAKQLSSYSEEYAQLIDFMIPKFESMGQTQASLLYQDRKDQINESMLEYEQSKIAAEKEFAEGKARIQQAKEEIEEQRFQLQQAEEDYWANSNYMEKVLYNEGLKVFESQWNQINEAQERLDEQEEEMLQEETAVIEQLDEGKQLLQDNQIKLDSIGDPQWLVESRNENQGYAIFKGDIKSIDGLVGLFPVIFFLVAALVVLTTMTRMIEDERGLIGTLKSLGYTNRQIMTRYLFYGYSATLVGSTFGVLAGVRVFPLLIWNAYSLNYQMDSPEFTLRLWPMLFAILIMTVISSVIIFIVAYNIMKETPANLLLPKAPPEGKRIWVERRTFIWDKCSFLIKVTLRNIFLDKKRMTMTVVGVVGSTALLVTAFGLQSSADRYAEIQFEEIFYYDAVVKYTDEVTDETIKELNTYEDIEDALLIIQQTVQATATDYQGNHLYLDMIIPQDANGLKDFVALTENGKPIVFNDQSVVLTNNLARLLDIKKGDKIQLIPFDKLDTIEVEVTEITKNIDSNYLYLGNVKYQRLFDKDTSFDQMFIKTTTNNDFTRITRQLETWQEIEMINHNDTYIEWVQKSLASIDAVVYLLIIMASFLAIVVLYNVTNINIEERKREISTLKVLGFYPKESSAYIFREIVLLLIIGSTIGIFAGAILFNQVIQSLATDFYTFDQQLSPIAYVYAIAFTTFIAVMINGVMAFKIQRIDMLESLKANE